jgi:hypothetical protein
MDDESVLLSIGKFLMQLFINKEDEKKGKLAPTSLGISLPIDGEPKKEEKPSEAVPNMEYLPITAINWESPTCNITQHFLVGDAITLHSWDRLANEDDGLTDDGKQKLVILCNKMEEIRTFLGCPINVHCMFRSQKYNQEVVKAIPNDVHAQFLAVDLDCSPHMTIQEVKDKMEPVLEKFNIRMEKGTTTWVHLDLRAPGPSGRYFTA